MRHLTFYIVLLILAGPALAARPDVRKMTCQQVQQMVLERGAVVATTGKYTYQRFVSDYLYCDYWEWATPVRVKTKDTSKCRLYICEQRPDDFGFGRFRRF